MKTKLFFSLVIFLTVAAFIFEKGSENVNNTLLTPPPPPVSTDSEFLINVMHSGIDYDYSEYPDLNTNAWHIYCGPTGGWPGVFSDNISTDPSVYGPSLLNKIDENRSHGFRSIMERPRTVHLAWSQRSEYQCENVAVGADYWFYAYNTHQTGNDINDYEFNGNGARVRYCQTNPSNPGIDAGYVVKDLRSNREQSNKQWTFMQRDDSYEWFVMPRIRIDTSFVRLNPDTAVCSIIMLDWDGDVIDSVNILARYFRDDQNQYNGDYLEEYNFPVTNLLRIAPGDICPGEPRHFWAWGDTSVHIKTDFRVYWYGLCDMWIDYVRVENEPAHQFFNPEFDWDDDVRAEARFADSSRNPANPIPNNFYLEEFEFNMVPSIKHFNDLVREQTQNRISLMVNLNYGLFKFNLPPNPISNEFSPEELDRYLVSRANLKYVIQGAYPLEGFELSSGRESYHPTSLSTHLYSKLDGILSYPASVSFYENELQDKFDFQPPGDGGFITLLKKADSLTQLVNDLNIIFLEQAHLIWLPTHKLKEPSNEEMEVMANVAITYGAKGIMWFAYNSDSLFTDDYYQRGMTEWQSLLPRTQSVYGQNKWVGVKQIDSTLKKWGPYIMSFDNVNRKSYILRLERDNLINETFFNDVLSYKPIESEFPGHQSNPETVSQRYLQVARFKNPTEQYTRYFMIVNRRCSPFNTSNPDIESGIRFIQMKLDSNHSDFNNFNNWSIYDLEKDSLIITFNKKIISTIDLGWYLPGEGKLFKIAPVMQEGGTLVTNEVISSGITFNCNGDVNNNGYDINIYGGTTIYFANDVKWNINGGEFITGLFPETPDNLKVNMYAQSGAYWGGINFIYCGAVNVQKTVFANVKRSPSEESNPAALLLVDCYNLDISKNEFNFSNLDSLSCIGINYLESPEEGSITANVSYNIFNTGSNKFQSLICNGFAEATVPLMVNGNAFNSSSGNIAIFLSNVSAGVIKNNTISNYKTGVNIISSASYADLYNNQITGDSIGAQVFSGTMNLGLQDYLQTGGFNRIFSSNINGNNIRAAAGYFYLEEGFNTFNINDSSTYHLAGTFPTSQSVEMNAIHNCFRLNNVNSTPRENVNCSSGLNCWVDFAFNPTLCGINQTGDYIVFDLGGGDYDTIFTEGGGMGGGLSNEKLKTKNEKLEITGSKELYNSICIEMRKRNFSFVHTKCMELLSNYIDSVQSMDGLSKLYHSSLMLDNLGNRMTPLKTFYETLILQNGENEVLIKKIFYLIQKCKVSLGDYQSAMTGFQQIMNQNPFSYEGLVASWDYAATSLLDSLQGGSGGAIKNYELGIKNYEFDEDENDIVSDNKKSQIRNPNSQIFNDDPNEKYDKKAFTKDDRKVIRENIIKSLETSRDKEIKQIKYLEQKVEEGTADANEKTELQIKIVLSEVVKAKKPRDIAEHINFVNSDIQKIFSTSKDNFIIETKNLIPTEYNLSQNYPNPFNPITKIKFDLPNDSKVKLVVYDILGREVKTIINEQLSIGRYEYQFDGANFASGVYFYRLTTQDFVQTRRMVLIK